MHKILIATALLLSVTTPPAFAEGAPTLKILTASGFGCKAVDSGVLHCSNPNTKDEYDCTPNPDAPCQSSPPPKRISQGGKLGTIKLHGGLTVKLAN
jgi:hypothetical protein